MLMAKDERDETITETINRLYAEHPEWHEEDRRFAEFSKRAMRRILRELDAKEAAPRPRGKDGPE